MKTPPVPNPAAQVAIAAIVLLGMVGGSLVLAHSGFSTSLRLGGPSVFVPAPQAYLLVFTMYGMSAIGLLALLRTRQVSRPAMALAAVVYVAVAAVLAWVLRPH